MQSGTAEHRSPGSNHPPGPLAMSKLSLFDEKDTNSTCILCVNNVAGIYSQVMLRIDTYVLLKYGQ